MKVVNNQRVESVGTGSYKVVHGLFDLLNRIQEANKLADPRYIDMQSGSQQFNISGNLKKFCDNKNSKNWAGVTGVIEYEKDLRGFGTEAFVNSKFDKNNTDGMDCQFEASVSGEFNDVDAYVHGIPECMADFVQTEANNYLTIRITAAVSGGTSLKEVQAKADEVLKQVNTLELLGTRCRIELVFSAAERHDYKAEVSNWTLIVKDFEESYVPAIHGYAIGQYSTIRAAGYAYWSLFNGASGLGMPEDKNDIKEDGVVKVNYVKDSVSAIAMKFMN